MFLFILLWACYLVGLYRYGRTRRLNLLGVSCAHVVPSFVATSMLYIFVLNPGATTVQFVAGSERGMNLWSLWVKLWPILLLVTASAVILKLCLALVAVATRRRPWACVILSGAAMSALACFTVFVNFPSA